MQSLLADPADLSSLSQVHNINIGILGHVDSGKTSLVRSLTQVRSTASLDKNPQSQERGITLDLGFSCFIAKAGEQYFQYTLVDCPGHASLIKTIIQGASIIDYMMLVIDVNKGIQTQTAECLVIAELLVNKIFIVLNKIDQIDQENRDQIIVKKIQQLSKVFSNTKFANSIDFIPVSALENININKLINTLVQNTQIPKRETSGKFVFLIDHCFNIKGKGTVVTGTVIEGSIKVSDTVEFPQINEQKQIKSIQMFKKSVDKAIQGDRIGMLFKQLEAGKIERGICSTPGTLVQMQKMIVSINKIKFFKQTIKNKQKFHIICGNQMVMGTIFIFFHKDIKKDQIEISLNHKSNEKFDFSKEYEYAEQIDGNDFKYWAILELEKPIINKIGSLFIGSKFDTDINDNKCRLAFSGFILDNQYKDLKVQRLKQKTGLVDRVLDDYVLLVKNLFKKETNLQFFINQEVILSETGNVGKVQSAFGSSGKVKCMFQNNVYSSEEGEAISNLENLEVVLRFKKYYYKHS